MVTRINFDKKTETLWKLLEKQSSKFPFYTYLWHKHWFDHFGNALQPYYLNANNKIIFPLVEENGTIVFAGGAEIADYIDCIGDENHKIESWKEVINFLINENKKKINLRNIPESSRTYTFFKDFSKTIIIQKEDTTPIVNLPTTWNLYLDMLSRKHRHELQRKMRKFENQFPNIYVNFLQNPQEKMDAFFTLMSNHHLKQKFLTPDIKDFFRMLPSIFPESFALLQLIINEQNAATCVAFKTQEELLLYNSAFDHEHFSGAGFYLVAKYLEIAIDKKYKRFNFLQGNERYKYELGARDFWVYRISGNL